MFILEREMLMMNRAQAHHESPEANRVSGDCICPECGHLYYEHPQGVPWYDLTLLCNGKYVKL